MNLTPKQILCVDSCAGLSVGCGVILLVPWLAALYALPEGVIVGMGLANLLYGSYSGTLLTVFARRGRIERRWLTALVLANLCWALVCITLLFVNRERLSVTGVTLLVFEALFVGGLGLIEWKYVRPFIGVDPA